MRRNDVASTSFRRHVPTRFLINQCQIITFLILKSDKIEISRIERNSFASSFKSNLSYIYYYFTLEHGTFVIFSLFHIEIEGKCRWIIGWQKGMLPPPHPPLLSNYWGSSSYAYALWLLAVLMTLLKSTSMSFFKVITASFLIFRQFRLCPSEKILNIIKTLIIIIFIVKKWLLLKGQDPHIRGFCIITSLIGYHS